MGASSPSSVDLVNGAAAPPAVSNSASLPRKTTLCPFATNNATGRIGCRTSIIDNFKRHMGCADCKSLRTQCPHDVRACPLDVRKVTAHTSEPLLVSRSPCRASRSSTMIQSSSIPPRIDSRACHAHQFFQYAPHSTNKKRKSSTPGWVFVKRQQILSYEQRRQ